MTDRVLHVFAYGSLMDPDQMEAEDPGARFVTVARFPDHRLCFPRPSRRWGGGAAGVEAAAGEEVWGVVYRVTPEGLEQLDHREGIAVGAYERRAVTVEPPGGTPLETFVYAAVPTAARPPSARYLDALTRGARIHGLPDHYISGLSRFR